MNLLRLVRSRPNTEVEPLADGAILRTYRGHRMVERLHLGPNIWHVVVVHADGTSEPAVFGQNLLTNTGRDLWDDAFGAAGPTAAANVATGSSATSLTDTGEAWTTNRYRGWIVVAEESTNTPVFGNIQDHTGTVLNIDQWWNSNDTTGTTPGTTANYFILPSCRPRFMALTENASAAAATDTALTGELTTGGCNRQLATYAHTAGTNSYTMVKSFSVTASFPAIHKGALLTASTTANGGGVMVFEAVLNADANVINGDTLQVTATITTTG